LNLCTSNFLHFSWSSHLSIDYFTLWTFFPLGVCHLVPVKSPVLKFYSDGLIVPSLFQKLTFMSGNCVIKLLGDIRKNSISPLEQDLRHYVTLHRLPKKKTSKQTLVRFTCPPPRTWSIGVFCKRFRLNFSSSSGNVDETVPCYAAESFPMRFSLIINQVCLLLYFLGRQNLRNQRVSAFTIAQSGIFRKHRYQILRLFLQ